MGLNIESQVGNTPQAPQPESRGGGGSGLIGGAMGAVSDIIGMIGQKKRNERAFTQQKELMGLQQANQMGLNQQGKDLALQQWKDTNYSAQVAEMEKAGLNPGLMYGMGGGGGTTANAGSGGGASGGSAPGQAPMEIGSALNNALMMSQKALIDAQTNKTNAEAGKLSGVDTANVTADTALKGANQKLAELEAQFREGTMETNINKAQEEFKILTAQFQKANAEGTISATTVDEQIKTIGADLAIKVLNAEAIKLGMKLDVQGMQNELKRISQTDTGLNQNEREVKIKEAMLKFTTGTAGQVAQWGNAVGQWTGAISELLPTKKIGNIIESVTTHANGKQSSTTTTRR